MALLDFWRCTNFGSVRFPGLFRICLFLWVFKFFPNSGLVQAQVGVKVKGEGSRSCSVVGSASVVGLFAFVSVGVSVLGNNSQVFDLFACFRLCLGLFRLFFVLYMWCVAFLCNFFRDSVTYVIRTWNRVDFFFFKDSTRIKHLRYNDFSCVQSYCAASEPYVWQ